MLMDILKIVPTHIRVIFSLAMPGLPVRFTYETQMSVLVFHDRMRIERLIWTEQVLGVGIREYVSFYSVTEPFFR
jgi:hypothetical protein